MSQERWDIVLRFLEGPLSFQGDLVLRGPVVRMGANPGPGGLRLDGYRGLDERQAVITAYDGGTVAVAPVGTNQVRVASHENVDWNEVQTLRGPVYLSPGDAFHLGPPGRGVTAVFVEARRLGVWEQRRILSDASDVDPEVLPSNVKDLRTNQGMPTWFIPSLLVGGLVFSAGILASVVPALLDPIPPPGPVDQGETHYKLVDPSEVRLDPDLMEGLNQPFHDFVMAPNSKAARWPKLAANPKNWDAKFLDFTTRSVTLHSRAWNFWSRLELIKDDYAFVVGEMREAGLPEVFAAIPYQESQYNSSVQSPVCAKGYWQFMPEVAHRAQLEVRDCSMRGAKYTYTPTRLIPVRNVLGRAEYVDRNDGNYRCRITGCAVDERTDLQLSTRAAADLLKEAWDDDLIAASGAAVQLTILSHNAGYDNSKYEEKKVNPINILPAYRRHLKKRGLEYDPLFYGENITCVGKEYGDIARTNDRCGGQLANQTQHYAYSIVAQHMLAVCYYALNHGTSAPFDEWRQYVRGDGYCTGIDVPPRDQVLKRQGK